MFSLPEHTSSVWALAVVVLGTIVHQLVRLHGRIQFSAGWITPRWDVDELMDARKSSVAFAGRLTDVLRYKRELAAQGPRRHRAKIRAYPREPPPVRNPPS